MYANSGSSGRGKPFRADRAAGPISSEGAVRQVPAGLFRTACLLAGILALMLVSLVACGRGRTAGAGTTDAIVFALESRPERLDPVSIRNPQSFRVAWQIYEGLLGLSDQGSIEPRIAESWESADDRIWTFRIRDGVRFHPSRLTQNVARDVTAGDVAWSLAAFCAPGAYPAFVLADSIEGCADYGAGRADRVVGIEATDDRTLIVRLLKPEPFFPNRLTTAWIAVFPKEASAPAFREEWGQSLAVGTGPFRLEEARGNEYILVRNDAYWDSKRRPAVAKVVFRVIQNDQIRLNELRQGRVDIMPVPTQVLPSVLSNAGSLRGDLSEQFTIKEYSTFNHHLIGINLTRVSDVHLRRAMNYATDRDAIVRALLLGRGETIGGPVPPSMPGFQSKVERPFFQLDRAREEISLSSYRGEPLELLVHDLAGSEAVGSVFQQQMKAIGVNIVLSKLDLGSVIGRVIKGDATLFSMFAEIVFSSPEPLLVNLFSTAKIPVPNFWKYSNPSIDEAIEQLRTMKAAEERLAASASIEAQIMQDVPAIFLYSQRGSVLLSRRIESLPVNAHDHFQLERLRLHR